MTTPASTPSPFITITAADAAAVREARGAIADILKSDAPPEVMIRALDTLRHLLAVNTTIEDCQFTNEIGGDGTCGECGGGECGDEDEDEDEEESYGGNLP